MSMYDKKTKQEEALAGYYQQLAHPLADVVAVIREIFLNVSPEIGEHIKWNSPAFFYMGVMKDFRPKEYKRDIAVINLRNPGWLLVIFPAGASIPESTPLEDRNYKDGRKIVQFSDMEDLDRKKIDLERVIREWLTLVEKPSHS